MVRGSLVWGRWAAQHPRSAQVVYVIEYVAFGALYWALFGIWAGVVAAILLVVLVNLMMAWARRSRRRRGLRLSRRSGETKSTDSTRRYRLRLPQCSRLTPERDGYRIKTMRRAVAILALVTVAGGCGNGGHAKSSASDCKSLLAATNVIEPAVNEMTGIPNSNADALHRATDAAAAVETALRRVRATNGNGTVKTARARLLAALNHFSRMLVVARTDLKTGGTQQQKSQGYVDAGTGIDEINGAQTAVLNACPKSG
jgi:hypothetical protein